MVIAKPLPGSLWIGLLLLISGCQAADDRYWYGNKQAILPGNLECEGEFDSPAQLIKGRAPVYPIQRMIERETGTAIVSFDVSPLGHAENLTTVERTHGAFSGALKRAIEDWEFTPATRNGETITVKCYSRWEFAVDLRGHDE